jgi:hypothetical protein
MIDLLDFLERCASAAILTKEDFDIILVLKAIERMNRMNQSSSSLRWKSGSRQPTVIYSDESINPVV